MATNKEYIDQYEQQLNNLAASIQSNVNLLAANYNAQADLKEMIETAENSIMLDVMQERFDVQGFPEYNKLKYTNAEQRKAAQQLAQDTDSDFQNLVFQRKSLYAEGKSLEAVIEFERRQFRAANAAMLFYSTNP